MRKLWWFAVQIEESEHQRVAETITSETGAPVYDSDDIDDVDVDEIRESLRKMEGVAD